MEEGKKSKAIGLDSFMRSLLSGTESSELFKAFLVAEEEEKYLEDLAKVFTVDKHRNFLFARSIILDMHIRLDRF